jgi:PIN domain nuclease of toxin-antitoxin system
VKLLLDTHVWLWMGLEPKRLGRRTRSLLEDPANDLGISVASAWEIVLKTARGKLELPMEPSEYIRTRFRRAGATMLPITLDHVLALASLKDGHADPFDRILIAQALAENRTLITADKRVLDYPILSVDARA